MLDLDPPRDRARGTGLRFGLLLVALAAATAIPVLRKRQTEFEWVFQRTARHLVNGADIYDPGGPPFRAYTYPPFSAALAIPFASLPPRVARAAWYLVNVASIAALWAGAWALAGGRRGRGDDRVAWIGLGCAALYILSNLEHQQTDLLIAALVVGGCLALRRSRSIAGATCFGLAAALKCTALLWTPYLIRRGRYAAAGWVVVVTVGLNLVPDLIATPRGGPSWSVAWFARFLRPMGGADYYPGRWYAWILDNQSIAGGATRWATTTWHWARTGVEFSDRARPIPPRVLQGVVYAAEATMLLALLAMMGRRRPAGPGEDPVPSRDAIEFGAVMTLMLLLSPMSSRPHFCILLLPGLCLGRIAVERGNRAIGALLAAAIACNVAAAPFWGRSIARLTMWSGLLMWSAAFLLIGCALALRIGPADVDGERRAGTVRRPRILGAGRRVGQETG